MSNSVPVCSSSCSGSSFTLEVLNFKSITSLDPEQYVQTLLQSPHHRTPLILRGFNIGPCTTKWKDPTYLKSISPHKKVKIHSSTHKALDFIEKNFEYKTVGWEELVEECSSHSAGGDTSTDIDRSIYYYLRALGDDPRARDPANLSLQFPELSKDLVIPNFFPADTFFSSVLRLTSPGLQLWTHYNTCDNILIQAVGHKRLVFFPPWEAGKLYLEGDKSRILDIDCPDLEKYPEFKNIERYEGILTAGDIAFIPALWFHNVVALDFSVSVNVFWKNLSIDLYDKKDAYGNKDLVPAQLALRTLDKSTSQLAVLPLQYQDFYLRRMIVTLQKKLDALKLDK